MLTSTQILTNFCHKWNIFQEFTIFVTVSFTHSTVTSSTQLLCQMQQWKTSTGRFNCQQLT